MMYEAMDLCNRALLMLGVVPLQTWNDATPEAEMARTFYPTVRDRVLAAHPWSFATRTAVFETGIFETGVFETGVSDQEDTVQRDTVQRDTVQRDRDKMETISDPNFPYRVPLPPRCVRVIAVSRLGGFRSRGSAVVPHRVIGSTLACPLIPVSVEYVAVVPEAAFPAFFSSVVITHMAAALCLPLTENTHRADHLTRAAERELHQARLLDVGSQPPPVLTSSVLVDVRQ